ncbi:CRPV-006 [Crowpox virus]|nr:CRPV-006 [Crowpox virus]
MDSVYLKRVLISLSRFMINSLSLILIIYLNILKLLYLLLISKRVYSSFKI